MTDRAREIARQYFDEDTRACDALTADIVRYGDELIAQRDKPPLFKLEGDKVVEVICSKCGDKL